MIVSCSWESSPSVVTVMLPLTVRNWLVEWHSQEDLRERYLSRCQNGKWCCCSLCFVREGGILYQTRHTGRSAGGCLRRPPVGFECLFVLKLTVSFIWFHVLPPFVVCTLYGAGIFSYRFYFHAIVLRSFTVINVPCHNYYLWCCNAIIAIIIHSVIHSVSQTASPRRCVPFLTEALFSTALSVVS